MQILHKTNINFVAKRKFFITLSIITIVLGITVTALLGIDYGIDFEGGIEMVTQFEKPVNTEQVRDAVESLGIGDAEIKSFGGENQYLIRIKVTDIPTEQIADAINKAIPDIDMDLIKVDNVGPKVGGELRSRGFLAIGLTVIAMLIYIAFRFEFKYGLAAIIGLFHDLVLTFAIAMVLQNTGIATMEINMTFLAAMLTVIGYSINDTVIIFDRIRENTDLLKSKDIKSLVNISLNETLSRTIITVVTVLIVLIVLMIFGGPVLLPFAIIMTMGIIFGTYSSLFICSSVLIYYTEHREKKLKLKKA